MPIELHPTIAGRLSDAVCHLKNLHYSDSEILSALVECLDAKYAFYTRPDLEKDYDETLYAPLWSAMHEKPVKIDLSIELC